MEYPRSTDLRALLDRESFDRLARAGDFNEDVCGAAPMGAAGSKKEDGSSGAAAECGGSFGEATRATRRLAKLWLEQDRLLCAVRLGGPGWRGRPGAKATVPPLVVPTCSGAHFFDVLALPYTRINSRTLYSIAVKAQTLP